MLIIETIDRTEGLISESIKRSVEAEITRVYSLLQKEDTDQTLELVYCDDAEIQKLNKQYRHLDKPTDVLSFDYPNKAYLGSLVISAETALRQAKSSHVPLLKECLMLAVHGLLHTLGYNHQD